MKPNHKIILSHILIELVLIWFLFLLGHHLHLMEEIYISFPYLMTCVTILFGNIGIMLYRINSN